MVFPQHPTFLILFTYCLYFLQIEREPNPAQVIQEEYGRVSPPEEILKASKTYVLTVAVNPPSQLAIFSK